MAGVNIGKIYPGWQSGTATLVAGSSVVTFSPAFKQVPNVQFQKLTLGTTLTFIYPGGVSTTGFTALSAEQTLTGGSLVDLLNGTTSVANFNWLAWVDN